MHLLQQLLERALAPRRKRCVDDDPLFDFLRTAASTLPGGSKKRFRGTTSSSSSVRSVAPVRTLQGSDSVGAQVNQEFVSNHRPLAEDDDYDAE